MPSVNTLPGPEELSLAGSLDTSLGRETPVELPEGGTCVETPSCRSAVARGPASRTTARQQSPPRDVSGPVRKVYTPTRLRPSRGSTPSTPVVPRLFKMPSTPTLRESSLTHFSSRPGTKPPPAQTLSESKSLLAAAVPPPKCSMRVTDVDNLLPELPSILQSSPTRRVPRARSTSSGPSPRLRTNDVRQSRRPSPRRPSPLRPVPPVASTLLQKPGGLSWRTTLGIMDELAVTADVWLVLDEFRNFAEEAERALLEQLRQDREAKHIACQNSSAPKCSPLLLNLRRAEQLLVKQKSYVEAANMKAEADVLESTERSQHDAQMGLKLYHVSVASSQHEAAAVEKLQESLHEILCKHVYEGRIPASIAQRALKR